MTIKLKLRSCLVIAVLMALALPFMVSSTAAAAADCPQPTNAAKQCCGGDSNAYLPSIDLGCIGKGNGIMDMLFAIIRFLSYGIGLIIVGSLTYAGIQYIGSRGDPNATGQAMKRIAANVTALLIFIFAFAIVNYIVPGAVLYK